MNLRYYQDNLTGRGGVFGAHWDEGDRGVAWRIWQALKGKKLDAVAIERNFPGGAAVLERMQAEWYVWRRKDGLELTKGAIRQAYDGWASGLKRCCMAAPTGAGKTEIAIKIAMDAASKGWRFIFVCDQQNLVKQTAARFMRAGVKVGVQWSEARKNGLPVDDAALIQVCSMQTLVALEKAAKKRGEAPLWHEWRGKRNTIWCLDEAHGQTAWSPTFGRPLLENPGESWFLGLTGSPFRLSDREGMGDLFDFMAQTPCYKAMQEITVPELVTAYRDAGFDVGHVGAILPVRYFACKPEGKISTAGVEKTAGEWNMKQMAENATQAGVLEAQCKEWERWGFKRTLAFCCTVEHAEACAALWASRGHDVGVVTGTEAKTFTIIGGVRTVEDRDDGVCAALASGRVRIVFSVAAMIKGVDIMEIDSGLMLRPTESFALYIQAVGRIRRPCAKMGKLSATLLDMTENSVKFRDRLETMPEFVLEKGRGAGEPKEKRPADSKECPWCHAIVGVMTKRCECGYEWAISERTLELHGLKLKAVELGARPKDKAAIQREEFRKEVRSSYHGERFGMWSGGRKNPGMVVAKWYKSHSFWPPDEWWKGAIFEGKATEEQKRLFRIHLQTWAIKRDEAKRAKESDAAWVRKYWGREFGD